jgi:hypothetical protein
MALKALLDSTAHGALAPELQAEYTEKDGSFILDLEDDIREHPKVKALKVALERTTKDKKKAIDQLAELQAKLDDIPEDFDAELYARLVDEEEARKAKKGKGGDDDDDEPGSPALKKLYEQRIASAEKKHKEEKEKLEDEKRKLIQNIERLVADEGLTKALIEAGVEKKLLAGAIALLRHSVKVKKEGDDWVGFFDDVAGEVPIEEYVQAWAQSDEGSIYIAKAKGGDGKGSEGSKLGDNPFIVPSGNDPKTGKPYKPNLTKQQDLIKSNPDRARQLATAAGVSVTW